jgi:hypothetical protein
MIGGIATLGASYLVGALAGAITIDQSRSECVDCKDVAPWLFVPVVGPFVGATQTSGGAGVLVLLGVVELVGAGLMTGGIIRYKRTKQRAMEAGFAGFDLPHNMHLGFDLKASSRFSGPQATLRF